ncbi:MAG TPA: hypothetical protein VGZ27_07810 [Vicinamibacterales bacterium]|nr:hypothetical protein [Vicinamibacterales bacterium]
MDLSGIDPAMQMTGTCSLQAPPIPLIALRGPTPFVTRSAPRPFSRA